LIIIIDEIRQPQHMSIMNVVWPVTALFSTLWIIRFYFAYGRLATGQEGACRHAA
jgi:hypothetical protein